MKSISAPFLIATTIAATICGSAGAAERKGGDASKRSPAYQLLDISLEATAREVDRNAPRPTVVSRTIAIIVTAMYDAWAAYDEKAVGSRLGAELRRPAAERTDKNKATAMAYACYRSMLDVYPEDADWIKGVMKKYGVDVDSSSSDRTTPEGIGLIAAAELFKHRKHDGANQLGDEVGSNGKPYSDFTFYEPINKDPKTIIDPDRWQPIPFDDGKGGKVVIGFLTPHWYRVKPFALERADQFRPGPPPKVGSKQLKEEVDECILLNATLTPEQKATVEFMRDGPRSTGQSGHWLRFAQDVSVRDEFGIDQDIKLFFAVANVAMDAFIASWESKRYYDSSRPWTLVRYYYKGQKIKGWAGPGKGVTDIPAEEWHPYSPSTFVTPPFPGYTSGHSTVSGACAKMLELATGSDRFGTTEKRHAGILTENGFTCEIMQSRDGRPIPKGSMSCDVALPLPTFTATAEMAGISRVMGGYHIQADNIAGLDLGRKVATYTWPKIKAYFEGTAAVRP